MEGPAAVMDNGRRMFSRNTEHMAALGIRRPWTQQEDATIRDNWTKLSQREIGILISRNHADVSRRGREIGLPTKHYRWHKFDDDVLRAEFQTTPTRTLARRLGRTPPAVAARAQLLGLQVSGGRGRSRA